MKGQGWSAEKYGWIQCRGTAVLEPDGRTSLVGMFRPVLALTDHRIARTSEDNAPLK